MNKEYLEALEKIKQEFNCDPEYYGLGGAFEILESALYRLESIDNAEPSEALEELIDMIEYFTRLDYVEPIVRNEIHDKFKDIYWHKLPHLDSIKEALIKAEKEHNSVNLLMQELDCKDFAELRKYARCGYKKLNKKYLKWEDLEFGKTTHKLKAKMNDSLYLIEWYIDGLGSKVVCIEKYITNDYLIHSACIKDYNQQFFNDLHLERVEE